MANDLESVMQTLLSGKNPQALSSLKSMLSTDENKKIISSVAGDGATLKSALNDAKRGNIDSAKNLVESLAKTPGGKELISKILHVVEEKKNG